MPISIYLDNNATTAVDPRVLDVVIESLRSYAGNPSSTHAQGRASQMRLTKARDRIASFLGVRSKEIIFTSGGTEAANLIIRGILQGLSDSHVVTSSSEHSCVYATIKALEKGCTVSFLSPGEWGAVTPEEVEKALRPNTRLIALMAVNNETGVKSDIEGIAAIAERRGIPFFVDGVAWLGKEQFKIPKGVSAISFSGHKIHAPVGVGFAFIRNTLKLQPILTGGDQEYGRRAGSENLSGIEGLAKAVEILHEELPASAERMALLRDRLERELMEAIPGVVVNGEGPRICNTTNLAFLGRDAEALMIGLDKAGIAVSLGSACASGAIEPSRVLLNMGISPERAKASLRFSLSRFTTAEEIDMCIASVVRLFGAGSA